MSCVLWLAADNGSWPITRMLIRRSLRGGKCLPRETVTAIMMLYKNMKAMLRSLDGDWFLRLCRWRLARKYISAIHVNKQPRLCVMNLSWFNKRMVHIQKEKKQIKYIYIYIYIYIYPTGINPAAGFLSQHEESGVSSHTEKLWYNEKVCLWMAIYTLPTPVD